MNQQFYAPLVREAELDDSAVFWFTLVVLDAGKEERQYVLQATAAQSSQGLFWDAPIAA